MEIDPTTRGFGLPPSSLHLQLLARIERVVQRGVDHVEDAARVGDAKGLALLKPVDGRAARSMAGQPRHNIGDIPSQHFLPDHAQPEEGRFALPNDAPLCHMRRLIHTGTKRKSLIFFAFYEL
jgi:hypothetical protein